MLYFFLALFSALIVVLDQWSKLLIVQHYPEQFAYYVAHMENEFTCKPIPVLDGIFHLTFLGNKGMGWSLFEGGRWVFVSLTVAVLVFMVLAVKKKWVNHPSGLWALAAISGGAVGNLIDRVRLGFVVDMIKVEFIEFPVFNVADCFVVCGAILLVIYTFFFDKPKKENADVSDAG